MRPAGLLLALLVLAAIVATVAASAAIPEQLTGRWWGNRVLMVVGPQGQVEIYDIGVYHARFSRVTTHRLSISDVLCSGTGTYRWTITNHVFHERGDQLKLEKIHDACKRRVELFAGTWGFHHGM